MAFIGLYAIIAGLGILPLSLLFHFAVLYGVHPRPHFHLLTRLHLHLSLGLLVALLAGFVAGAIAGTGFTVLYASGHLIEPPVPAQVPPRTAQRSGRQRGLGLVPAAHRVRAPRLFGAGTRQYADLSAYMPPVRSQGAVASCSAWAIGYTLRGYYAAREGHYPAGGFAPYYSYSQLAGRRNVGTTLEDNFRILAQQGVDTWRHYTQMRRNNFWDRPTAAERRAARRWRTQGYQVLFAGAGQGVLVEQAVRQALVNGDPVVLGIPIYENLLKAGRDAYYVSKPEGAYVGLHAMVATKADGNGVWLLSSWGRDYGLGGYVEVSYNFLDRYAEEGAIMVMPRELRRA